MKKTRNKISKKSIATKMEKSEKMLDSLASELLEARFQNDFHSPTTHYVAANVRNAANIIRSMRTFSL